MERWNKAEVLHGHVPLCPLLLLPSPVLLHKRAAGASDCEVRLGEFQRPGTVASHVWDPSDDQRP